MQCVEAKCLNDGAAQTKWKKFLVRGITDPASKKNLVHRISKYRELRILADIKNMGNGIFFIEVPPLPENKIDVIKSRFDRLIDDTSVFVDYNHPDIEITKLKGTCLGPEDTYVGLYLCSSDYADRYGIVVKSYPPYNAQLYSQSIINDLLSQTTTKTPEHLFRQMESPISSGDYISKKPLGQLYQQVMKEAVQHRKNVAKLIFEKCGIVVPRGQSLISYIQRPLGHNDHLTSSQPIQNNSFSSFLGGFGFGYLGRSTNSTTQDPSRYIPEPNIEDVIGPPMCNINSVKTNFQIQDPSPSQPLVPDNKDQGEEINESEEDHGLIYTKRKKKVKKPTTDIVTQSMLEGLLSGNETDISYRSDAKQACIHGIGICSTTAAAGIHKDISSPCTQVKGNTKDTNFQSEEHSKEQKEKYRIALNAYFAGTANNFKLQYDYPVVFLSALSNSDDLLVFVDAYQKVAVHRGAPYMIQPWNGFHSYHAPDQYDHNLTKTLMQSQDIAGPIGIPESNRFGELDLNVSRNVTQTISERVKWKSQVDIIYYCHPSYYGAQSNIEEIIKAFESAYKIQTFKKVWRCKSLLPTPPREASLSLADYYNFGLGKTVFLQISHVAILVGIYHRIYQEWKARLTTYGFGAKTKTLYPPTDVFTEFAHPQYSDVLMLAKLPKLSGEIILGHPKKIKLRASYQTGKKFQSAKERELVEIVDKSSGEGGCSNLSPENPKTSNPDLDDPLVEEVDLQAIGLLLHVEQFFFDTTSQCVTNTKYKSSGTEPGQQGHVIQQQPEYYHSETEQPDSPNLSPKFQNTSSGKTTPLPTNQTFSCDLASDVKKVTPSNDEFPIPSDPCLGKRGLESCPGGLTPLEDNRFKREDALLPLNVDEGDSEE